MTRPSRRSAWIPRLAALLALTLAAVAAPAQSVTSGALEGTVRSADGSLLNDASILLTERAVGSTRPLPIAPDGRFGAAFLPTGSYDLLVEQPGFAPRVVRGVVVRPGERTELRVVLSPAAAGSERVDTTHAAAGAMSGSRAGQGWWFGPRDVAGLPTQRWGLDELARLSSVAGDGLEAEGLPARMSGVVLDGVPLNPARHPGGAAHPAGAVAFPLQVVEQAELATNPVDVEWGGFAGAYLNTFTRRGTRELRVDGFGSWATGSLAGGDPFASGSVSHGTMQGGVLVSGPIVPDTAGFVLGVEARRLETPLQYGLPFASAADSLGVLAPEAFGGADGRLLTTDVLSGFGRLDWQFSGASRFTARANVAAVGAPGEGGAGWLGRYGGGADGLELSAAASLASQLSRSLAQEARAGIQVSRRGAAEEAVVLPATAFAVEGLALGSGGYAGSFDRTTFFASETFQQRSGAHLLKLGAAVSASRYEGSYLPDAAGEFYFSTLGAFAGGQGYFVQPVGTRSPASFTIPRVSGYLQDTWTVAPGLAVLLGLRVDADFPPADDVAPNADWAALTGVDSTALGTRALLGPRFGFRWDGGQDRWVVRGAAGIYYDEADPAVIGEAISNDGGLRIRRGAGDAAAWPGFPQGAGTETGPTLSLLAPDYEAPRSARGSLGISRVLGAGTVLHLSASWRRTEYLPRRADLNLAPTAGAEDPNGRPVFGTLVQQGGLVFAQPGSNRRFSGFDRVYALNTDGWSEYRGATVAFEHRAASPLTAFGSYTYSSTEDNWVGARGGWPEAQLAPFAGREGNDWTEGRSDFDVPHRAVLGAELGLGGRIAPRLAAVYRFRSGHPFTPGFRPGVDANGDGSARNDPAFVDPGVPGFAEAASGWDCLAAGGFAVRNSCRQDGVHSLDARIALDLLRTGRGSASLVVDGLNLLSSDAGEPDTALYLVDPARSLGTADGRVTLPLVANPNFGSPVAG
ncbi:MAG TPA: carboxypeptidase-like regulatory domain-containing protein, partial [Longimicrobiaceae bacterium]|nr:carboxypeptidase-like regulatory domain-containing protein [Longimicrobiaceae bacterium]